MLSSFALHSHVVGCNALAQSDPVFVPDYKTMNCDVQTLFAVEVCGDGCAAGSCSITVTLSGHCTRGDKEYPSPAARSRNLHDTRTTTPLRIAAHYCA